MPIICNPTKQDFINLEKNDQIIISTGHFLVFCKWKIKNLVAIATDDNHNNFDVSFKNVKKIKKNNLEQLNEDSILLSILNYQRKGYKPAKWMEFSKQMLLDGWDVYLYRMQNTKSKYVYIFKDDVHFKTRFSNHKPNRVRESHKDCDYFAGISHKDCLTTETIIKIIELESKRIDALKNAKAYGVTTEEINAYYDRRIWRIK